jgi:hypothetical protein
MSSPIRSSSTALRPIPAACGLLLAAALAAVSVRAAPAEATRERERNVTVERFTSRLWSQNRPNLHYDYGCETGWHSFNFRLDGYFLYDGKISGHWWIDHLSNVVVQTNAGERMELFFNGDSQLAQLERSASAPDSAFGTEYRTYQECPIDKVRLR